MTYQRHTPTEAPQEFDAGGSFHAQPGAKFWGEFLPALRFAEGKPIGLTDAGWWTQERGKSLAAWLDAPRLRWLAEALIYPHTATRYVEGSIRAQLAAAAWWQAQEAGTKIDPETIRMPGALDPHRVFDGVTRLHAVAAMITPPERPPVSLTAYVFQRLAVVEAITVRRLWPKGLNPNRLGLVPEARKPIDHDQRMRDAEEVFK